eukprot:TRINITY_DN9887_c1_g1_i2.p1 TRINITY_DN9887_c1_g1~~TRINITY_DN9887_c1_g1_i2.p1  ORF type:complete len:229 (-),score=16.46 TRINITY_DN9887_c1_g1_i2:33-629(-)
MKLHMDGARLMNAAVRTGIPVSRIVKACDTISLCLSKALAAPIGSVVAGTRDFVVNARRMRKALGGGWRQAGVLAAAGILSITKMIDELKWDHENCELLARKLWTVPGILMETHHTKETKAIPLYTNMIFFELDPALMKITPGEFRSELKKYNVLAGGNDPKIRLCFHYHIKKEHVQTIFNAIAEVCQRHVSRNRSKL